MYICSMKGQLILFPVPIGAEDIDSSLPAQNIEWLASCRTFIVEELRTARRFLKKAGYPYAIDDTTFHVLNEHTTHEKIGNYLDAIENGENIGLLSGLMVNNRTDRARDWGAALAVAFVMLLVFLLNL